MIEVEVTGRRLQSVALIGDWQFQDLEPQQVPPYRFTLLVPSNMTLREYSFTPIGIEADGTAVIGEPIALRVERNDAPTSLVVVPNLARFRVGESMRLQVTAVFGDDIELTINESSRVSYSTDNATVVTVDHHGMLTAVASGAAMITVTYGGLRNTVPVTVVPPFAVTPLTTSLHAGETIQLHAVFNTLPPMVDEEVRWTLSPWVGEIGSSGIYTAPAEISRLRTITVIATSIVDPNLTASALIRLLPPTPRNGARPIDALLARDPMAHSRGPVRP